MSKCEYQNEKGHCTLNECMYGDFLDRDDSMYGTGYPLCFKPEEKLPSDYIDEMIEEQKKCIE